MKQLVNIYKQTESQHGLLFETLFRFLFIFGWLRVAETLYNPFGEDDEDFELNEILDRHFRVAMTIVDDVENPPELTKDIYWSQKRPCLSEQML